MVFMGHKTIFQIFLKILKNEFCVYYRHVPKKNFRKDRHMFTTVTILLVILAGLCTALYKITYPTCTARRCGHQNDYVRALVRYIGRRA